MDTKERAERLSLAAVNYRAGIWRGLYDAHEMFALFSESGDLEGFGKWLDRALERARIHSAKASDAFCSARKEG